MQAKLDTSLKNRLPPRIARLEELAFNLWWSWHWSARELFRMIDRRLWSATRHNPLIILHEVPVERLQALAKDPAFLRTYDSGLMELDRDMQAGEGWFEKTYPDLRSSPIAYFSAEFGVHTSLPIYSGGLGILSGDHLKESSDLGLPFVAVGFLYEQGYFRQRIDPDGRQKSDYPEVPPGQVALHPVLCDGGDGRCRTVEVRIADRTVNLQIWKVVVGRTPLHLMDADYEGNAAWDRELTRRLYSGDQEMRIQQEVLLGIGGVRLLRTLGIAPRVWHINEGHSAFMVLERLREHIAAGMSLDQAKARVRETTVFTTHTPVAAGHDVFPFHLMDKYFAGFAESLGVSRDEFLSWGQTDGGHAPGFNMTALALRLAGRSNGVSRLHGDVSRRMWRSLWPEKKIEDVPIGHVTNGVHAASWVAESMHALFRKHLDPHWRARQDDKALWERVDDLPDAELWATHRELKRKMFIIIRERARRQRIDRKASPDQLLASGIFLDPGALVIGFARRFATYKRANLVLRDYERLLRIIHDRDRPVQLIFAGKAHPADEPGKNLLQEIYRAALDPRTGGRIAFIEDYDMQVARYLVQGVDVWLNTPRRPLEASGTSGMKAALNGVPSLSVLDGWWAEAYNGRNGWAIDPKVEAPNPEAEDEADAAELHRLIAEEVAPLFYQRDLDNVPRGWVRVMKEAIKTAGPQFSARRMVQEYSREYYVPALKAARSAESKS